MRQLALCMMCHGISDALYDVMRFLTLYIDAMRLLELCVMFHEISYALYDVMRLLALCVKSDKSTPSSCHVSEIC